jgi:hypothetical protein
MATTARPGARISSLNPEEAIDIPKAGGGSSRSGYVAMGGNKCKFWCSEYSCAECRSFSSPQGLGGHAASQRAKRIKEKIGFVSALCGHKRTHYIRKIGVDGTGIGSSSMAAAAPAPAATPNSSSFMCTVLNQEHEPPVEAIERNINASAAHAHAHANVMRGPLPVLLAHAAPNKGKQPPNGPAVAGKARCCWPSSRYRGHRLVDHFH